VAERLANSIFKASRILFLRASLTPLGLEKPKLLKNAKDHNSRVSYGAVWRTRKCMRLDPGDGLLKVVVLIPARNELIVPGATDQRGSPDGG